MKRRNFLRSSVFIAAGTAIQPLQGKAEDSGMRQAPFVPNANTLISPIIPIGFFAGQTEVTIRQIKALKQEYGLKRFIIMAPSNRTKQFPSKEEYRKIGEALLETQQALQGYGVEVGWRCAPSIRCGHSDKFQYHVTNLAGKIAINSPCPLDLSFREELSDSIAMVMDIAKPSLAEIEDDFVLSWQPPTVNFGCFCPLHLAEFSKRQGRIFTREQLMEIFSKGDRESINLRYKWAELSRDTLADFARLIRQKVDKVSPQTRILLCQASNADFDGDFTEAVARAFAGNTRPITRLHGIGYSSDIAQAMPQTIFSVLYHRQHLPADIECVHESDTYPHVRFFQSAAKMRAYMTAAFAYGLEDSSFFAISTSLDNDFEERGYLEMYKREASRFSKIKEEVANAEVVGCEIVHLPFASAAVPYKQLASGAADRPKAPLNPWISVLGPQGIPYATKGGKVKLISGDALRFLSDEEIEKLLRSAVMLDGYAAYVLSERGYGRMIGAEVERRSEAHVNEADVYMERIRNKERYKGIKGEFMRALTYVPGRKAPETIYMLKPGLGAEVITDILDRKKNPLMIGSTQFENEWGGRAYITAYDLNDNPHAGIGYVKKQLLRETIEWLGKEQLPVFVKDLPNVFCICNKSSDGGYLIVTMTNLCSDKVTSLSIDVSTEWANANVSQLQDNGRWAKLKLQRSGRTISLKADLMIMEPITLKLTRNRL